MLSESKSPRFALITGTSSGLGLAMAQFLLDEGWAVLGCSRRRSTLEHELFFDFECDLNDEEAIVGFVQEVAEITDELDLVVNNAGICLMGKAEADSIPLLEKHLLTNTIGAFQLLTLLRPLFMEHKTHIVSILSTAAKYAYPNSSGYVASKFALRGILESLQKEWKASGYRFTQLYPGAIDTPLWDQLPGEFSRARMLSLEDYLEVFAFVVNSPAHMRIADLTFLHNQGVLE
jgi:NAD(P)-dependent dehydrogenase (short-subunit alcohol dehydrogenase family)